MDHPTLHFRTDPVAGIAGNFDGSTRHLTADMSPGISLDPDVPLLHSSTDPMDTSKVPRPVHLLISGVTGQFKEIRQRTRLIAMKYR
jgi:hypothetical protein